MNYEKDEDIINEITEEQLWSIKLGFNGELTEEFFKKLESVKNVRNRIMNDYYISIIAVMSFSCLGIYIYNNPSDFSYLFSLLIIFNIICFASIFVHLKIIFEWIKHDKMMVKEWTKKNTTTLKVGYVNIPQ